MRFILLLLGVFIAVFLILCGFFHPVQALSVLPDSNFGLCLAGQVNAASVLLAVEPGSFIPTAIRPNESALPFLLVIYILTFINAAIRPREATNAVHLVVVPLTFEPASVTPCVDPLAFDVVVHEVA